MEKNAEQTSVLGEITLVKPQDIEAKSMEIIERELQEKSDRSWSAEELPVVKRCIHTSADFDYGENLEFTEAAVKRGIEALRQGADIVTDTNMAAAGINKRTLKKLGGQVRCFMADEDVAAEAKARGITRATVCMERGAALKKPVIFAVGNAPTALIRLYEMILAGEVRPALIIGVPVGFVNVVESKKLILSEKIREAGVPCIVARGRKGGSNIAATICNALLYQCVPGRGE